jgi:hypothetical protein
VSNEQLTGSGWRLAFGHQDYDFLFGLFTVILVEKNLKQLAASISGHWLLITAYCSPFTIHAKGRPSLENLSHLPVLVPQVKRVLPPSGAGGGEVLDL